MCLTIIYRGTTNEKEIYPFPALKTSLAKTLFFKTANREIYSKPVAKSDAVEKSSLQEFLPIKELRSKQKLETGNKEEQEKDKEVYIHRAQRYSERKSIISENFNSGCAYIHLRIYEPFPLIRADSLLPLFIRSRQL